MKCWNDDIYSTGEQTIARRMFYLSASKGYLKRSLVDYKKLLAAIINKSTIIVEAGLAMFKINDYCLLSYNIRNRILIIYYDVKLSDLIDFSAFTMANEKDYVIEVFSKQLNITVDRIDTCPRRSLYKFDNFGLIELMNVK